MHISIPSVNKFEEKSSPCKIYVLNTTLTSEKELAFLERATVSLVAQIAHDKISDNSGSIINKRKLS